MLYGITITRANSEAAMFTKLGIPLQPYPVGRTFLKKSNSVRHGGVHYNSSI